MRKFAVLLLAMASPVCVATLAPHAPEAADAQFQATEHYRFNLGGDSGQYTDWERTDLPAFDGLATTITIGKVYGRPGDRFGAIARINLFSGPSTDKDRKVVSFIFEVDRKTQKISADLFRSRDLPREGFDLSVELKSAIELTVLRVVPGKLVVTINGKTYDVDCDFDIHDIAVIGSGIDVSFEPFNFLHRTR